MYFTLWHTGTYNVRIFNTGQDIQGSPRLYLYCVFNPLFLCYNVYLTPSFLLKCFLIPLFSSIFVSNALVDPTSSIAYGAGLVGGVAGEQISLTIQVKPSPSILLCVFNPLLLY
jgi:hypothetical protein